MERLYKGTFECRDCDITYQADQDPESELVCEECEQPLVLVGDLEGDDDDEEEI